MALSSRGFGKKRNAAMTLSEVNAAPVAEIVQALGGVFENAPWVAERAAGGRPYDTVEALHAGMMAAVRMAPEGQQLAFLRQHPELGGAAARAGQMTEHSIAEQQALGLNALAEERAAEIERLNAEYTKTFGFPFIICVSRHTRASIISQFVRRLDNTADVERRQALDEIGLITRLRLVALVEGPGMPVTVGALSTHVLDTARGRPASGVPVALYEIDGEQAIPIVQTLTNADGRTDAPLMSGGPVRIGHYELQFSVGGLLSSGGRGFLDVIPVRFGITDAEAHYHVPLLVSPFAYSTYLGS